MKYIILIFFIINVQALFAQSATDEIKETVESEYKKWLIKSDFETNDHYAFRIENRNIALDSITKQVISKKKEKLLKERINGELSNYDIENETYFIKPDYDYHNRNFNEILLSIHISKDNAIKLKELMSINYCVNQGIEILPTAIAIVNDLWSITEAVIILNLACDDYRNVGECFREGRFRLNISFKDNKVYCSCGQYQKFNVKEFNGIKIYKELPKEIVFQEWNYNNQPNYISSTTPEIKFDSKEFNITIPNVTTVVEKKSNNITLFKNTQKDENEIELINVKTLNSNPNAIAVIIGNKNYRFTKEVSYSINDVKIIKQFLINVLGYKEGNIFYFEDATKSTFETYFGTQENPKGKLYNNIKQDVSDVFIYYAGHGAPSLNDRKGYFLPVDCDPQYVEQGGYSLDLFYKNLALLPVPNITVLTDACFSGADVFQSISSVIIVPKPSLIPQNCVVFNSSSSKEVSTWYDEKQHGLFTYFFIKAIQDKEKSDTNKDYKLTFNEIFNYISDKTEGVPYYARKLHNVQQMPTLQCIDSNSIFIEFIK